MLNIVEQLIGPDILGHPVWNLRTKTPHNEATVVPWHQGESSLITDQYIEILERILLRFYVCSQSVILSKDVYVF